MIGLDTNVLVRYLTQDDPEQSERANKLIETWCSKDEPGRVSLVVLCELVRVLRGAYGYEKHLLIRALQQILSTTELEVESQQVARSALSAFRRGGADFADYVIVVANHVSGCEATYSFDQKLGKHPLVLEP